MMLGWARHSETCSAGQLVPLNTIKKTTQIRGHFLNAVNARQLSALLHTLFFLIANRVPAVFVR
jgi:hypothetical protein